MSAGPPVECCAATANGAVPPLNPTLTAFKRQAHVGLVGTYLGAWCCGRCSARQLRGALVRRQLASLGNGGPISPLCATENRSLNRDDWCSAARSSIYSCYHNVTITLGGRPWALATGVPLHLTWGVVLVVHAGGARDAGAERHLEVPWPRPHWFHEVQGVISPLCAPKWSQAGLLLVTQSRFPQLAEQACRPVHGTIRGASARNVNVRGG